MPLLNERSKEKPIILIAEDNESNYMLFKSILQKDYELVHAWDGEEAVELHQKFHPHVVIMDINMPKWMDMKLLAKYVKYPKRYLSLQ